MLKNQTVKWASLCVTLVVVAICVMVLLGGLTTYKSTNECGKTHCDTIQHCCDSIKCDQRVGK